MKNKASTSLSKSLCTRFEHSRARNKQLLACIREDNLGQLPRNTLKLGYPWFSLKSAQLYPYVSDVVSRLIPTYTDLYQIGISRDISLQESYPCISQTTFLSRLISGYPGISHNSGYPGISSMSRDMAGCHFTRWKWFEIRWSSWLWKAAPELKASFIRISWFLEKLRLCTCFINSNLCKKAR